MTVHLPILFSCLSVHEISYLLCRMVVWLNNLAFIKCQLVPVCSVEFIPNTIYPFCTVLSSLTLSRVHDSVFAQYYQYRRLCYVGIIPWFTGSLPVVLPVPDQRSMLLPVWMLRIKLCSPAAPAAYALLPFVCLY